MADGELRMIVVRAAGQRGGTRRDGVDCRHAFSAGDFHDAAWMGWGALRVVDEVVVAPGAGFGPQRRANMEILSYVIDGALLHRDGDGVEHVIEARGLHWVGAGRGVDVDERNASATVPLRVLQAWVQPDRVNAAVAHGQVAMDGVSKRGGWQTLVSPDGVDDSVPIRQRAWLRATLLAAADCVALPVDASRRYWLQVLRGSACVGGYALVAGDAVGIADETTVLDIVAGDEGPAELLAFDLPA